MPAPGEPMLSTAGSESLATRVGMLACGAPAGVVMVNRQNIELSVAPTVGAPPTASTHATPSRDDSLTTDTWAWPLTTGVATEVRDAQSVAPFWLPSGG